MSTDIEIARKRVQARMGFIIHVAIYTVMNGGLFAIWLFSGKGYPWFMWPLIGWGVGVIAHAGALAIGPGSAIEERAVDKELRRLRIAPR